MLLAFPQRGGQLGTGHARHVDIEHQHVRVERPEHTQGLQRLRQGAHLHAGVAQHQRLRLQLIRVVIDQQHTVGRLSYPARQRVQCLGQRLHRDRAGQGPRRARPGQQYPQGQVVVVVQRHEQGPPGAEIETSQLRHLLLALSGIPRQLRQPDHHARHLVAGTGQRRLADAGDRRLQCAVAAGPQALAQGIGLARHVHHQADQWLQVQDRRRQRLGWRRRGLSGSECGALFARLHVQGVDLPGPFVAGQRRGRMVSSTEGFHGPFQHPRLFRHARQAHGAGGAHQGVQPAMQRLEPVGWCVRRASGHKVGAQAVDDRRQALDIAPTQHRQRLQGAGFATGWEHDFSHVVRPRCRAPGWTRSSDRTAWQSRPGRPARGNARLPPAAPSRS